MNVSSLFEDFAEGPQAPRTRGATASDQSDGYLHFTDRNDAIIQKAYRVYHRAICG